MRDISAYPQRFSPQVKLQAKVLMQQGGSSSGDHARPAESMSSLWSWIMSYDITFGRLDEQHGYSLSRSTRISEIGSPGTSSEHVLSAEDEHGFLWRMNTYWSYEERDAGLYMQIELVFAYADPFLPGSIGWFSRLLRKFHANRWNSLCGSTSATRCANSRG